MWQSPLFSVTPLRIKCNLSDSFLKAAVAMDSKLEKKIPVGISAKKKKKKKVHRRYLFSGISGFGAL